MPAPPMFRTPEPSTAPSTCSVNVAVVELSVPPLVAVLPSVIARVEPIVALVLLVVERVALAGAALLIVMLVPVPSAESAGMMRFPALMVTAPLKLLLVLVTDHVPAPLL